MDSKGKKIEELEEKINKLNIILAKQLSEEKNGNVILKNKLSEEKERINNILKENKDLKKKIEEFNSKNQQINTNQNIPNSSNLNELVQLYKKIENLNEKLKRYPIVLEENEKLMSIIFSSIDEKMIYSMICKNTDTISDLEKRLYKEYPDFSYSDNYFLCKGKLINRYQTFEDNKLKNGDVIILKQRDD